MKRYKIVSIAVSIILIIAAVLVGCDSEAQAYSDTRMKTVFELTSNNAWWGNISAVKGELVIDTQTGVEYWYIYDEGGSSLTLLVDKDGKPLIWKGE